MAQEVDAFRPLLCFGRGKGLTLVRLAAFDALDAEEKRKAKVSLQLQGQRLHVAVRLEGGSVEAAETAARRALDAAVTAATPLRATISLPVPKFAGQLVGRGGREVRALQHEVQNVFVGDVGGGMEARPTARVAVLVRVGVGAVQVTALSRVSGREERARLLAEMQRVAQAHVARAERRVQAAAAAAHARAEEARVALGWAPKSPEDVKEMRDAKRARDARRDGRARTRRTAGDRVRAGLKRGRAAQRSATARRDGRPERGERRRLLTALGGQGGSE